MKNRTKYTVVVAHSGTTSSEVAKAKRHFRKSVRIGSTYGSIYENEVTIQFIDANNSVCAHFTNSIGEEVCSSIEV